MAVTRFADRCRQTSTTTGTSPLVLEAAETGWRALADVYAVDEDLPYAAIGVDVDGNLTGEWEVGEGLIDGGGDLVRTTVKASSNAGAAVNFSSALIEVFVTLGADAVAEFIAAAVAGKENAGVAASLLAAHEADTTTHGISSFGATLVDDANAGAARTTLGLGSAAVADAGDFDAAGTGAAEASAAVGDHEAATDPHPQYGPPTIRGTVTFDFGVGGAAAARVSIADAAVTSTARVTYGVRVPTSRSLDELEFAPLFPGHQVRPDVGIDLILVCMGTATGQFQLDYEYSRS